MSAEASSPGPDGATPVGNLTYSEASRELDEIVGFFEHGELDVDQLVGRLERATAIVEELDRRLRRTKAQVEDLVPRLEAAVGSPGRDEAGDDEAADRDDPPELFS